MYFFESFGQKVERLRDYKRKLNLTKKISLQKGNEFNEILRDLEIKKDYFEKSNSSSSLLRAITIKYKDCQEKFGSEIKALEKSQRNLVSGIEEIFSKGNSFQELYLYTDFIPEQTFHQLVVTLVKGHKENLVSYNSLKGLKSYREEFFEKGTVYVKDTRTAFADTILINDKNEILFLVRNKNDEFEPGKYCLPGGHVEGNENFKAAAIRELSEETGIELKMSDVVPCGRYLNSKVNIHFFTAKYNGNPSVLREREQVQYEWVPFDKVGEKPLIMDLKQILEEIVEIPRCILNSNEESSSRYYFDGSYIVNDEDAEIQKSLDKLCKDFNEDKIGLLELQKSCNSISLPHEVFFIRKGGSFKCFARLLQLDSKVDEESLEKAIASGKLVKKKKLITRSGRTFLTTVWVKPDGDIAKEEVKKEIPEHPVISELTVGDEVTLTTSRGDKKGTVSSLVDTKEGICIVLRTPEGKATEVYLKALKGAKKASPSTTPSPGSVSIDEPHPIKIEPGSLKKKAKLGGSSEVSLVELDSVPDRTFVLKTERSRDTGKSQLEDEACADKLYSIMGYDAPASTIVEYDGKTHKLSTYIQGRELGSLTGKDKDRAKELVQKGFVMDCLLGNWDVIGASQDNILVVGSGESMVVYRIDNGSALRHRAKGALKPDSAFLSSTHIPELMTMRDASLNPTAAEIFAGISNEEIRRQAQFILKNKDKILSNVDNPTIQMALKSRLNWLESRYGSETVAKEDSKPKAEERKPKAGYSSIVTEEFFEKAWDTFEFKANEGCKEKLKSRIKRFEKNRDSGYRECAEALGLSVEEYKAKLQSYTEAIFAKSKPFIAIDSSKVLPLIFTSNGRFKSQFEVKSSRGSLSPTYRSETEAIYFDFPDNSSANKDQRPVYGYMSNHPDGIISKEGKVPPSVSQYGNVYVEIKRSKAIESATCTFGDSLGHSNHLTAVPFGCPHFTALDGMHNKSGIDRRIKNIEDYIAGNINRLDWDIAGTYTELQYHGQLKLEDVEAIHLTHESFDKGHEEMSAAFNNLLKFSAETGSVCPVKLFTTK